MTTYEMILFSAALLFFTALLIKCAYFKFVVEAILKSRQLDWSQEPSKWVEMRQIQALTKVGPETQGICQKASLLFRIAIVAFFVPVTTLLVGAILKL